MIQRSALLAAASAALFAGAALAQPSDGVRQLGAHVHGAAELIAAADPDGQVVVEFMSAGWNLYGFEGAVAPERMPEVERVAVRLAEPGLVVFSPAARCALADVTVVGAPAPADGEPHTGPDHGAHEHADSESGHDPHETHADEHGQDHPDHGADHHGHGHDEAHDDDHQDGASENGGHGDVVVNWSFQCDRPARITALDLSGLFSAFERLERVDVQYLDTSGAAARTLTPAGAVLQID